jgi:hypothetical protein
VVSSSVENIAIRMGVSSFNQSLSSRYEDGKDLTFCDQLIPPRERGRLEARVRLGLRKLPQLHKSLLIHPNGKYPIN